MALCGDARRPGRQPQASLSKDPDGSVIYYPRSSIRSTKCSAVTMFIVDKLELPRAQDAAARARAPTARARNTGAGPGGWSRGGVAPAGSAPARDGGV